MPEKGKLGTSGGERDIREAEAILPTEMKALTQCKERLFPSLGSACSISWDVLSFTNKLLAVLLLHKILSFD